MKKTIALLCFFAFVITGCFSNEYLDSIQESIRVTNERAMQIEISKRKNLTKKIESIEGQLTTIKDIDARMKITDLLKVLHSQRKETYYFESRHRRQVNDARLQLDMPLLVRSENNGS